MIKTDGVKFNPLFDKWSLSKDTSINYISKFTKNNFLYPQTKIVIVFQFLLQINL